MKVFPACIVLCIGTTLTLGAEETNSGQALFNNSCKYCHGEAGKGNTIQDQFFKTKIPRLNSDYVQKKSDAELTNVILNGKRKMPAAMLGHPEMAHRTKVKPEQVPELIAYIRTLKK